MEVLAAGGGAADAEPNVAADEDPEAAAEAEAEADARFAAAVAATPPLPPPPPPFIPFTDAAAGFPEANFAAPPPMLLAVVAFMVLPRPRPRPRPRLPALDMGDGSDPLEPELEPEAEADSDRAGGIGMAWCVELMLRVIEVRSRTVGCDMTERTQNFQS
jgi:hypothetical protein